MGVLFGTEICQYWWENNAKFLAVHHWESTVQTTKDIRFAVGYHSPVNLVNSAVRDSRSFGKAATFSETPSDSSCSKQQAVTGQGALPAQEVFNPQLTEPVTTGLLVCCACIIYTSLIVVAWYVCAIGRATP